MLGEGLGGGDPGDLRECAGLHVAPQQVEQAVARLGVGAGAGLVVQRAARLGVAVVVEVQQRVVAVVAAVGVVDPAPGAGRVQAVADVLVDLPGDAGLLQPLGVGGPAVPGLLVAEHRAAAGAVVAGVARPHVVAVRVGGADERAVVGVAEGERVGERVVERDVLAGQIGHRGGRLGRHPLVVLGVVERLVAAGPVVVEVLDELHAQVVHLRAEREDLLAGGVRLVPDRLSARKGDRAWVAEAAHALHRAEVVVERTVLLHQHDDVLDVLESPGGAGRGDRGGTRDALRQRRERGGGARQLEETAPVQLSHGWETSACHGGWRNGA